MSPTPGAAGDRREPDTFPVTDDELGVRIARALRTRADAQHPDLAAQTARLRAAVADHDARPTTVIPLHRGGKIVAAGVLTGTLAFGGASAAAATNPYSPVARAVEEAAGAVGLEWSFMPEGYTRAQHDALWDAGYQDEDLDALGALWQTSTIETKSRTGQLLLDGLQPPVPPGADVPEGTEADTAARTAFWEAGYTAEDLRELVALWQTDALETKARAGHLLLQGEPLPIEPSGQEPGTAPADR